MDRSILLFVMTCSFVISGWFVPGVDAEFTCPDTGISICVENEDNGCLTDIDGPGNFKCCPHGCTYVCMGPIV